MNTDIIQNYEIDLSDCTHNEDPTEFFNFLQKTVFYKKKEADFIFSGGQLRFVISIKPINGERFSLTACFYLKAAERKCGDVGKGYFICLKDTAAVYEGNSGI